MRRESPWQRVRKSERCPICGRPDWCLVTGPERGRTAAICARVKSEKSCGQAGWLHRLRDDPWRTSGFSIRIKPTTSTVSDFGELAARYARTLEPDRLAWFAASLGLTLDSLLRLCVGWSHDHQAWTFPMRDATGKTLGIRLRLDNGRKLSVRDGREGLFLPDGVQAAQTLLVCEGPTDCAAMLDLGFAAVGRPSCTGGRRLLVDLVQRLRPAEVVIVADADAPGQVGAENLAAVLVGYVVALRVVFPPEGVKDARHWKQQGAAQEIVRSAIEAAPVRRCNIQVKSK